MPLGIIINLIVQKRSNIIYNLKLKLTFETILEYVRQTNFVAFSEKIAYTISVTFYSNLEFIL